MRLLQRNHASLRQYSITLYSMSNEVKRLELRESQFTIRDVRFSDAPWYDLTTARFLSVSDTFYEDIEATRTKLGISQVDYYKYNPDPTKLPSPIERAKNNDLAVPSIEVGVTPAHLVVLRYMEATTKLDELNQQATAITNKYGLAPRWQFPIQILLLTDTLVLPIHGPVYSYLSLPNFYVQQFSDLDIPLSLERKDDTSPKLTIVINEKMTINELVQHISNSDDIKEGLTKLPSFAHSRVKEDVMMWGHLVWAAFTFVSGISNIKQVEEYLVNKEVADELSIPNSKMLNTYYQRYLDAQHKLGY